MNKHPLLALADLKDMSEEDIKAHLAAEYGVNYGHDIQVEERLKTLNILIAYENTEGYESSCSYLFQEKRTGKLFEMHGSHCSCHGYEGLFTSLDETDVPTLFSIVQNGGGDWYSIKEIVSQYVLKEFVEVIDKKTKKKIKVVALQN
jgi:hypothetical protein